ncbi:MAG: transcriptional repressor LexA [Acidimicrobiaceae bacterium]|nr:transcriptional repressor LexA [Acidimicrobiaceae bacterium]
MSTYKHVISSTVTEATMSDTLTTRQREILDVIVSHVHERGYPPSVREIGEAVGLRSPATVKCHLDNLRDAGYLKRDLAKPRAIQVNYTGSNSTATGSTAEHRPVRHIPLVGDVAAGTDVLAESNVEELVPMPEDLTGSGELFMLRVRGDSMIDAGIFDGDFVVCRRQETAEDNKIVVAGIPGDEATVKTLQRRAGSVVLVPANSEFSEMVFDPQDVQIFGQVVTVMRKL